METPRIDTVFMACNAVLLPTTWRAYHIARHYCTKLLVKLEVQPIQFLGRQRRGPALRQRPRNGQAIVKRPRVVRL